MIGRKYVKVVNREETSCPVMGLDIPGCLPCVPHQEQVILAKDPDRYENIGASSRKRLGSFT